MQGKESERDSVILRMNTAGIGMNLILAAAKLVVGFMIHSRAVVLDALNGFSDIISSLVSMLSTKFASRRSDREHPFGYGRLEYISAMFSTVVIICMGLHAAYGAIRELTSAEVGAPDYNAAVVVVMIVSMAAKTVYGLLSRKAGKRIRSVALIMCGTEAIGDSIVSLAILVTIALYCTTGVDLEPWLSILISLFIVKTGVEMIRECISKLLGSRGDPEEYLRVKKLIAEEDAVLNVFNLVIHRYGEDVSIGSVDIEVDETMTTAETTLLVRRIRRRAEENGVTLSAVGVYGANTRDPKSAEMWDRILTVVRSHSEFLRAYAFSYDAARHAAAFVVVPDAGVRDRRQSIAVLDSELRSLFPGTDFEIEAALEL